ncbi:MAG TPA: hypothetical protein VED40_18840 [Azospirillaceae bacterium]|nr:hypothetical protein [Azospirillaceae bacterium]
MIDEHRETSDAVAAPPGGKPAGDPAAKDAMSKDLSTKDAPRDGEIQESVDPFDYAETIVRDLAVHVGSRLRDFRSDLAAMHSAVVSLPETMKINALGQSIQELRERVAHLTGVVSHHAARPQEELDRLNRGFGEVGTRVNELGQRLGTLEAWLSQARAAGGIELPELPAVQPVEQFDKVVDQIHESILRIVGAVRELQLDLRDLRIEVRKGGNGAAGHAPAPVAPAAPPAASQPSAPSFDPGPQLRRFSEQLADFDARIVRLGERVDGLSATIASASGETATGAVAPAPQDDTPGLASLVFAAWPRLMQPTGAEALRTALDQVIAGLARGLKEQVRAPELPAGPGLAAVMCGRVDGRLVTALLAVEDLEGRAWRGEAGTLSSEGAAPRTACWRALLAAAAMAERARPGSFVSPIIIYGNGQMTGLPGKPEVVAYAAAIGAPELADRLLSVAAPDFTHPGLLRPGEVAGSLVRML